MAGRDIVVTDQGSVIFKEEEAGGLHQVSLKASAAMAGDYSILLPTAKGSSTQQINATTTGDNVVLSFATVGNVGMAGYNVLQDATGDGSTDDTASIITAINNSEGAGLASQSTRTIFPAGIYSASGISSCFETSTDAKNYWLEGAGQTHTTIKGRSDVILIAGRAQRTFVVKDMTLHGNAQTAVMLEINSAPYILIDNVEFRGGAKAIKIEGAPKVVAITNCRFADMTVDGLGPMIDLTGLTADCTIIFKNNYVSAGTPSSAANGTSGLQVSTNASSKSARCFIRDNHFTMFGKTGADGAVKLLYAHDSVIEGNVFSDIIADYALKVSSSNGARIIGNSFSEHASLVAAYTAIEVDGDASSCAGVEISGNTIVGTVLAEHGIICSTSDAAQNVQDVSIHDNDIEGCSMSIYLNNVKGQVSIGNNAIRESLAAHASAITLGLATKSAMRIGNIINAANVGIVGNHFEGGANSGGALYFDTTDGGTHTASKCHLTLRDNLCRSLGQKSGWTQRVNSDMALIYIRGHATYELTTIHASGNRYDFDSSQAGTYGMYVEPLGGVCTFDSIMEFGARPGEISTIAIARAELAAGVGGSVHIPSGTFQVNDRGTAIDTSTASSGGQTNKCIEISHNNQRWYGEGIIQDVLSNSDNAIIDVPNSTNNVVIQGLRIEVIDNTNTATGIKIGNGKGCIVKDCHIEDINTGIHLAASERAQVACNNIVDWTNYAISVGTSGGAICNECNVSNNTTNIGTISNAGTILIRATNSIISNNHFATNYGTNVLIDDSTDLIFQGNTLKRVPSSGLLATTNNISIVDSKYIIVSGNSILTNTSHAFVAELDEINIEGAANTEGISIVGNVMRSQQVKVHIDDAVTELVISNNIMYDTIATADEDTRAIHTADATTLRYGSICGNIISATDVHTVGNEAIGIGAGKNFTIAGNQILNYYTGIEVLASNNGNLFYGNSLSNSGAVVGGAASGDATITGANKEQA